MPSPVRLISLATAVPPFVLGQEEVMAEASALFRGRSEEIDREKKAWKDVWSAGQGVGNIHDVPTTAELVATLKREYDEAMSMAFADYRAAAE